MLRSLICVLISLAAADYVVYADRELEANIPQSEKSIRISFPWEPRHKWILIEATGEKFGDLSGSKGWHNHEEKRQEFPIMCNLYYDDHDSCREGTHEFTFWRMRLGGADVKVIKINYV